MKLFAALVIGANASADSNYLSYKEIATAFREGNPYDSWWVGDEKGITDPNAWRTCGEPNAPKNSIAECNGDRCASICTPGFFTEGRFDGVVCRKEEWKADLADCETCAMPEILSRPGLDSYCEVTSRFGRMTCNLQCTNGSKIFGKLERPIACKCHNKNGCHWMFTGKGMRREEKHKVDLDALERICPRPANPDPLPGIYQRLINLYSKVKSIIFLSESVWLVENINFYF